MTDATDSARVASLLRSLADDMEQGKAWVAMTGSVPLTRDSDGESYCALEIVWQTDAVLVANKKAANNPAGKRS